MIEYNFLENFLKPETFRDHPHGMLPMCYPGDHYNGVFIPNWAMWFVLQLEDRMHRVGDAAFIAQFRNRVYALVDFFKQYENADGLLEYLPSWVFVEWSMAERTGTLWEHISTQASCIHGFASYVVHFIRVAEEHTRR